MSRWTGDVLLLCLAAIHIMLCAMHRRWEPIPPQILTIAVVIVSGKLGGMAYDKWPIKRPPKEE